MHTGLTRESIVIKCNMEASIMTGNYEYYYCAGLLCQLMGKPVDPDIQPEALHELVTGLLPDFTPNGGQEQHMARMLKYYHPDEKYDEQMAELLKMGLQEQNPWKKKGDLRK
jgi:hypothetical protein